MGVGGGAGLKLFAYGTLRRRGRLEALIGRRLGDPEPAVLEGYRLFETEDGYPVILPEPGSSVAGLLWDVGDADLRFVDHYEGSDERRPPWVRMRLVVRVDGREEPAWVYVGNPDVVRIREPAP